MENYKLYGIFIGLNITILLICDTLAFKVIRIFGFSVSASGFLFPFSFLLSSITAEVYGYKESGKIIYTLLLAQAIFIVCITVFVHLNVSKTEMVSQYYFLIYQNFWRVLIASSIAIWLSYFANNFLISKLKINMNGRYFIVRVLKSNAVGKALLVLISYPINFYGIYPMEHILEIAFNTWIYKMGIAICIAPLGVMLAQFTKKFERVDHYDYGISYNPIEVFTSENKSNIKRQNLVL